MTRVNIYLAQNAFFRSIIIQFHYKKFSPANLYDNPTHDPTILLIQGDHNILDMLLMSAALLATNGKGHNVLHIAALKVRTHITLLSSSEDTEC